MKKKANFFSKLGLNEPNTFIGGVSSVITTNTELASYLSITHSAISNFTISGDDISCYINSDYLLSDYAFNNDDSAFDWGNGNIVTYYWDNDGRCTGFERAIFDGQTNLHNVYFPGVTTTTAQEVFKNKGTSNVETLYHLPNLTTITNNDEMWLNLDTALIVMPECTQLYTTADDSIFNLADRVEVYVDVSLSTNNGGNPDGDLTYLNGRTDTVINYSNNNTSPSSISDLSLDTAYGASLIINWSAPSSSNSIDYYLVFVNHKYIGKTTSLSYYITGLEVNTSYDIFIVTLDSEGNTSFSNTLTQATNSSYYNPTSDLISYWNFDTDSTDQVGTNDGTDTSVSYVSGLISNCADFTAGTSSNISVADDDSLSFGNSTTDSPFSSSFWVKFNVVGNAWFYNKRGIAAGNIDREYQIYFYLGKLSFTIYDQSTGGFKTTEFTWTPTTGVWYHIGHTYSGSGQPKLFLNGVAVGSSSNGGTYVAMENVNAPLTIGKASFSTLFSFDGYMDECGIANVEWSIEEMYDIYQKGLNGIILTD